MLILVTAGVLSVLSAWGVAGVLAYRKSPLGPTTGRWVVIPNAARPEESRHAMVEEGFGTQCWKVENEPVDVAGTWRAANTPRRAAPAWVALPALPAGPREGCLRSQALGFPFVSMKHEARIERVRMPMRNGGSGMMEHWDHRGVWIRRSRGYIALAVPLLPVWSGLVGNTAVIGAVLALPWGFRVARRRSRVRRGCCPFCGYDVRGEFAVPCPECGKTADSTTPVTHG